MVYPGTPPMSGAPKITYHNIAMTLVPDRTCSLNNSDPLGVTCKHGSLECVGNAHELCLVKHLDPAQWYAVLACLNFESPFPGKIGDVKLTRRCVEATKLDWWGSGVGQCIQGKKAKKDDGQKAKKANHLGKEARGLLLENVARTEQTSVTKSCTIVIDSTAGRGSTNRTCVIDGGAWIGCDVSCSELES